MRPNLTVCNILVHLKETTDLGQNQTCDYRYKGQATQGDV